MRIRSVTGRAFGRLDGDRLEFAEGLTVVTGPNESGKSTWHAAITAAIGGMRRGQGRRHKTDQEFTDRHRPWDRDEFEVSAVIDLADGRSVELHHDLAGLVDCTATDTVLGIDLTPEILHDGNPDASRFVGLTRTTFRSIACVGQGRILQVIADARTLQEDLGRAAATAGSDETAAGALQIIDEVLREDVGTERANATKPLRRAMDALAAAEATEAEIRRLHADWQEEREQIADAEERVADADRALAAAEAARAHDRAEAAEARLERLEALDAAIDRSVESAPDRVLVDEVRDAVSGWDHRPEPVEPDGDDVPTLTRRLDDLPEPPTGDLIAHPSVVGAAEAFSTARFALAAHRDLEPESIDPVLPAGTDAVGAGTIRTRLTTPLPEIDVDLVRELDHLEAGPPRGSGIGRRVLLAAAGVLLVAGIVLAVIGPLPVGAGVAALGAVIGVAGLLVGRSGSDRSEDDAERILVLRATLASQQRHRRAAEEERARAFAQAQQLGLPTDPDELDHLLAVQRAAEDSVERRRRWTAGVAEQEEMVERATIALHEALRAREVDGSTTTADDPPTPPSAPPTTSGSRPDPDAVEARHRAYLLGCAERAEQQRLADSRTELRRRLDERIALDRRHADDRTRIDELGKNLRGVARRIPELDPAADAEVEPLVDALRRWHERALELLAIADRNRSIRTELTALLDGRPLDQHRADVEDLAKERQRRLDDLPDGPEIDLDEIDRSPGRLDALRAERQTARGELIRLTSAHRAKQEGVASVPEAVEVTEAARAELARVRRLADDLRTTAEFLRDAQERANRDLAPQLANAVRDQVHRVTGGRYRDLRVNPIDLAVTVLDGGGRWRDAAGLSHGTTEQIYLLLRIALADLLVTPGRSIPMLLDDVLVQTDSVRSREMFETLREIADRRQIILFSQEDDVVAWAREQLRDDPRHRHVELTVAPTSP